MPAIQPNAESFNPNHLNLVQVASYERLIQAPLERVWENVLDWEHLPWLHKTSFDYIELVEAGTWGWRTWSSPDQTSHVELTRVNEDSYVARTYQKDQQISEIWTELHAEGNNTRVNVSFHFVEVEESRIPGFAENITKLYTRLWDEDEAMMMERHQRLLEERATDVEKNLGDEAALRQRLANDETIVFQLARREYQLRMIEGQLLAHSTICPHLLGPLTNSTTKDGKLFCPWHGYQFDMTSGECVTPEDATCHLAAPPALSHESGNIIARSTR